MNILSILMARPIRNKKTIKKSNLFKPTPAEQDLIDKYDNKFLYYLGCLMGKKIPTTSKPFPKEDAKNILSLIKPGDLFLETNDYYPLWQISEKVICNSDYTHTAIYEGNGKLIEADEDGVKRTDIREYFKGPEHIAIIRPPYKSEDDIKGMLNYANAQIGKNYDEEFNLDDDSEIYCSELAYHALRAMPNPITSTTTNFFGKKIIGPNYFEKTPGAKNIYSTKNNFWTSIKSHVPFATAIALGGALGALAKGPVGSLIGAFATAYTLIKIENKKPYFI